MSGRFNRFKSRKTNKDPDSETSSLSGFDEQGFLCPICYQKFTDQSGLAQHYVVDHPQPSTTSKDEKIQDSSEDVNSLKQKFKVAEESRLILIGALQQEKQRVNDLESDLQVLQKQLRHAQTKLSEQSEFVNRQTNNNIDSLRSTFVENQMTIDRFFTKFSTFDDEINGKSQKLENDFENLQQTIRFLRERKSSFVRNFRFLNEKLTNELRLAKKQNESYRDQIENLQSDIQQLEMTISLYKEEHLRMMKTNNNSQDEQSNLFRKLNEEKNLLEQQNKDFRQRIKTIKQENEEETNRFSRQIFQLTSEKNRFEEEISALKSQLNRVEIERESQKKEFEQWKIGLTKQIGDLENEKYAFKQTLHQNERLITELKFQLKSKEIEKIQNENFQNQLTQMRIQFHKKDAYLRHLSTTISRCVKLAQRLHKNAVEMSETNVFALVDQVKIDSSSMKTFVDEYSQSIQQIQIFIGQREKRFNEEKNLLRQQIRDEHRQIIATNQQQKEQIERLENQIHQLVDVKRNFQDEREKCIALENELESRSKRHEMQLAALKENLATVRTELKSTNEKLAQLEQIKAEKTDLEGRLAVSQDERRVLLERSLTSENKIEKLLNENGQLTRKLVEKEAGISELAREHQVLQMQMTKLSQRRWLNDDDIHACMKCHQTFSITQRKHHCRSCGNIFCDSCSSKNAVVAASSKKPQRVCDQCYKDLTS